MRYPILLTAALMPLPGSVAAQLAQPPAGVSEGALTDLANRYPMNPELGNLGDSPSWSGWGGATNARYQPAAAAGINAADVPKLPGFPGGIFVLT